MLNSYVLVEIHICNSNFVVFFAILRFFICKYLLYSLSLLLTTNIEIKWFFPNFKYKKLLAIQLIWEK